MLIDVSTKACPNTFVQVDEQDAGLFEGVKWTPTGSGYVHRQTTGRKKEYLHRVIMGARPGDIIDHINRDRSDNRRSNLRLVDHSENARNRSGWGGSAFRGIHRKRDRWQASIAAKGEVWNLGCYGSQEEAAAAYDDALAYFGLTASGLNLPDRAPQPIAPERRNIGPHGFPGVRQLPSGRFGARVIRDRRRYSIGTFATAEEAVAGVLWERENG